MRTVHVPGRCVVVCGCAIVVGLVWCGLFSFCSPVCGGGLVGCPCGGGLPGTASHARGMEHITQGRGCLVICVLGVVLEAVGDGGRAHGCEQVGGVLLHV